MKRAILALLFLLAVNAGANEGFGVGGNGATGPSGPSGPTGAAGGGGGTGTTNQHVKFTDGAGGVIGDSGLADDGTTVSSAEHFSVTTKELQQQYTNNTSTGTTASKFVKWDGSGKIVVAAAATDAIKGICRTNCGTSGSAQVTISGSSVPCVFDNATTANDYVTVSSAGGCHDSGATFPTGTPVVGTIPSTNGGAGTYNIDLNGADVASATVAGGGNGKIGGSGTAGQVAVFSAGTTLISDSAFLWDATNNRLSMTSMTSATDASAFMFWPKGTLPAIPTTTAYGMFLDVTSAGSAGQIQVGVESIFRVGYTGSSSTVATQSENAVAGTGGTPAFNSSAQTIANFGTLSSTSGAGTGWNVGAYGEATNNTGINAASFGKATSTVAGTNIGTLGVAGASTEGTDFKDIGGYFTNAGSAGLITGSNASVSLIAQGTSTNDIFRAYNDTTLKLTIASTGAISTASTITSSATGALGWTPVAAANQACNTTCTSACVFGTDAVTGGILACTDATADSCLCAGSS